MISTRYMHGNCLREAGAASSNLATPTSKINALDIPHKIGFCEHRWQKPFVLRCEHRIRSPNASAELRQFSDFHTPKPPKETCGLQKPSWKGMDDDR